MNTEHRQQKFLFFLAFYENAVYCGSDSVAAVIVILYTLMIMPGVKSNIRSIYSDYLLIFPFRMEGRWKGHAGKY